MQKDLKLITMSNIEAKEVDWLWYPYIPFGKLSIVQGDPGEGKTTFVLALIALLTTGAALPGQNGGNAPISVLYQTAEDGLADTIKPRLVQNGADCSRVHVIDDSQFELTLDDGRILEAIAQTGARLLVFDPLQAYLGAATDMHRANDVRNILKRLHHVAEETGCAVVLIGHLNKMQGAKHNYRLLGSVDFTAAVRSVLMVGRTKDDPHVRVVAQGKSNLAPTGRSIVFRLDQEHGFSWEGFCDVSAEELGNGACAGAVDKTTQAVELLKEMLSHEEVPTTILFEKAASLGISERTMKKAKQISGATSVKKGGQWFSSLATDSVGENQEGRGAMC